TAKLLGLPYPGGPEVEKAALLGDSSRFSLPRPLKGEERLDFSFSGLKTAVRQLATTLEPLSQADVNDICAAFQDAVADTLNDRVSRSLARFRATFPDVKEPALVVAGGVAANKVLRTCLQDLCTGKGFRFIAPPMILCTDNAAMIAWAGAERADQMIADSLDIAPRSRWPLDMQSAPLIGAGRRGAKA
ncbi:MAG: tRNA (adenosine(37)-N6)-threonylcarbamoyltransferase complex transferase subunit TsaD, partial [Pyrinomonadaceae bacterium]